MAQQQNPHHHHPCQPYPSQGGAWDRASGVHRLGQGVAWAAGVAMAAIGGHTWAAVIVVNSLADNVTAGNSLCTLREAARNANNNSDTTGGDCLAGVAGADTIDLSGLTGTITLGGTQLSFTDAVTVQGPAIGTLTIDGNHASRIFYIDGGGAGIDLTISRLTLTHARGGDGGAIHVGAVGGLTINQCVITGNTSTNKGGAIFFSTNAGGLTISNSTISNNTASGSGGALFLYNVKATSSISGSTISGNTSTTNRGGGIFLQTLRAPWTISDSTISGNTATGGAGRGGGMVLQQSITLVMGVEIKKE